MTIDDLKEWLHKDFGRLEKLLMILASFDKDPATVEAIRKRGREAGFSVPARWNISDILRKSAGKAINAGKGWELTRSGREHIGNIGVQALPPGAVQVASDLRKHCANITNEDTKKFVEEAIGCFECRFYRSAVVMSWLAAVDVLYNHVINNRLAVFNTEAKRVNNKWKAAKTNDDLSRMKELDFLDRLAAISVIGKNVKEELQDCLGLRNGTGHPNSLQLSTNMVAAHIECLLLNVFNRF